MFTRLLFTVCLLCAVRLHAAVPLAPTGLNAVAISASKVDLSWSGSATRFLLERQEGSSSSWTQFAVSTATSYRATALLQSKLYRFRVRGENADGQGPYSNIASATTPADTVAPTVPGAPQVTRNTCSSLNMWWRESTDADMGVSGYKVYRGGVYLKTVLKPVMSTTDTGLAASTSYCYSISSVDVAGNESAQSAGACQTTDACSEVVPPFTPVNLVATPVTAPNCGQITLTWDASSDNVGGSGLQGYKVYRNGTLITEVNSGETYTDRLLAASTVYSYRVSAYDVAGNESSQSTAVTPSTPACADVTAPTVPTGLTVDTSQRCTGAALSWTGSTDSGGSTLRGYKIYRDGVFLRLVTSTSANDLDLQGDSTYSWRVSAIDNGSNESAQSTAQGGSTMSCIYTKRFGGTGSESGRGVKIDAAGSTILCGYFGNGNLINFGGSDLVSAGSYDIFLVKFDNNGDHLWSKRFGGTGTEFVNSIATDANNNILVAGQFTGTANFGGDNVVSAGANDIFVAKYDSTGTHQWSRGFGNTSDDTANSVAVDSSGNVFLTGGFVKSVNLGGATLNAAFAGQDTFIAKYSSAGNHIWARNFTSTADDQGMAITVDSSGNPTVTGYYAGLLNCGNGNFATHGGSEIYVCKLTAAGGVHTWSRSFGGSTADKPYGITVDSSNNVIVFGLYTGSCDFGSGTALTALGSYDLFIAKYTSSVGAYVWAKSFGSTGTEWPNAVTVDMDDNVICTGFFPNTINLGGGSMTTTGQQDVFVGKYSSAGTFIAGSKYGGISFDDSSGVATDLAGNIFVTGYFYGTANFGAGALTSAGSSDAFLLRLDPNL